MGEKLSDAVSRVLAEAEQRSVNSGQSRADWLEELNEAVNVLDEAIAAVEGEMDEEGD